MEARTDAPWHAQVKKMSFQVCACRSYHALQTFEHPILALSPDGLGSIDCHVRPCRPWAECLSEGVCSIAGSLWTVQSVLCCCLIAAWGPAVKSFLDPIAGLGKLGNICVWFPKAMLEERDGHGGIRCRWSEWKFFSAAKRKVKIQLQKWKHFTSEWKKWKNLCGRGLSTAFSITVPFPVR